MEIVNDSKDQFAKLAKKLAGVRVSVRSDLETTRQIFEGTPAYVIQDPINSQSLRLTSKDYQILVAIDTQNTLGDHFETLIEKGHLTKEDEESFYRFILHLHQVGLLVLPLADGKSLYRRYKNKRAAARRFSFMKLLFVRIPLCQPDSFLTATLPIVKAVFTRAFFVVWAIALAICLVLTLLHWSEFREPLSNMLTLESLPLVWLLLVGLKTLHELGHAYACKRFGGHVPEIGVILILLTPCAYVDATSSWGFSKRSHRIIVGLAGMYFESIASIVACIVWLLTEPGIIHSAAMYAMVLSTVVTIGFNGNPLMRYDGYFILSDLVNIPNLRSEARIAFSSLVKRVLFGVPFTTKPTSKLKKWFLRAFGCGATVYATFVLFAICMLLAIHLPMVGPFLALFMFGSVVLRSIKSHAHFVLNSEELNGRRTRAIVVALGLLMLLGGLTGFVPVQQNVQTTGILTRSEDRVIHATQPGFLVERFVDAGARVAPNTKLVQLSNIGMDESIGRKESEIAQLKIEFLEQLKKDHMKAETSRLRLVALQHELNELNAQRDELVVRADGNGEITQLFEVKSPGRFVRVGDPLMVASSGKWRVRSYLSAQHLTDSNAKPGQRAKVLLLGDHPTTVTGTILSCTSAPVDRIAPSGLTLEGGGSIQLTDGESPDLDWYEMVIELDPSAIHGLRIGTIAYIELAAEPLSLGGYLIRRGRRLFDRIQLSG